VSEDNHLAGLTQHDEALGGGLLIDLVQRGNGVIEYEGSLCATAFRVGQEGSEGDNSKFAFTQDVRCLHASYRVP